MVMITVSSGDDDIGYLLNSTVQRLQTPKKPIDPLYKDNPLFEIFKKVMGKDYFEIQNFSFYSTYRKDPFLGDNRYVPSFGRLTNGLLSLYKEIAGRNFLLE